MKALVVSVRFHDGRYHGRGDWPPAPARLFQALVAGTALAGPIADKERAALLWLEKQRPPIIAAPRARRTEKGLRFFVPNNEADRIGGDAARRASIRTGSKDLRPWFFDPSISFLYAWPISPAHEDLGSARVICGLAEKLYQLGLGIDVAWAWGEVLDRDQMEECLAAYPGQVLRPAAGKSYAVLACPRAGFLASLDLRYRESQTGLRYTQAAKGIQGDLRVPPRPQHQMVAYDSPPVRKVYELRPPDAERRLASWRLEQAYALVVRLRDLAVRRLKHALPGRSADIERVLVGRRPDGSNACPPENRVRIYPLPSIGHVHADRRIRRVLVDVPAACLLPPDDIHWAFSGLDVVDEETEEVEATLVSSDDERMLRHYGVGDAVASRVWRTVTPAALPQTGPFRAGRGRSREKAGSSEERLLKLVRTAYAVRQALRHAGVRARPVDVHAQREPFEVNVSRAEAFAPGSRFPAHRLWHVEIEFEEPLAGPLAMGDGRFCGLGLMAPVHKP